MGQPAFSNAYVQFDTTENALSGYEAFEKWAEEKNDLKDVDFDISSVNVEDSNAAVTYTVSSGRYQNCEWQCEEIRDFFIKQKGCVSVEQDILTCENSVSWRKDDKS